MSGEVINISKFQKAAPLSVFRKGGEVNGTEEFAAGIQGGFGVISYRGKVWRVKFRGDEHNVMNAEGEPVSRLKVILLRGSPFIAKNYYEKGYTDGADTPPDCFSTNGVKPDPASPKPQCATCAACPQNVFGSRKTEAGKNAKACSDSRRLAVVPADDPKNEMYGGPMLLRVPATSLAGLKDYAQRLSAVGFNPWEVYTSIGFDVDEAYPKFTFRALNPINEEEVAEIVMDMRGSDAVENILSIPTEAVTSPPDLPVADEDEDEGDMLPPPKSKPRTKLVSSSAVDEDEVPAPKTKAKPAPAADEDEDDMLPPPHMRRGTKPAPVADEDEEEEEPRPIKAKTKTKPAPVADEDEGSGVDELDALLDDLTG